MSLAAAMAAALAACSPQAPPAPAASASAAAAAPPESSCPDDGPRFPITGICQGRAIAYFETAPTLETHALPDGCVWTVNESPMPGADEALLYFAASCEGVVTQLEVRGGAQSAALGYVKSAVYKDVPSDFEPVRMFPLPEDPAQKPDAMILALAQGTTADKAEAAACAVVPAAADGGYPAGAMVVDVSEAYRAAKKLGEDSEYAVCGDYGFVSEAVRYWLVRQGFAWLVDYGQDLQDIRPETLTIFHKGADGAWAPKPD